MDIDFDEYRDLQNRIAELEAENERLQFGLRLIAAGARAPGEAHTSDEFLMELAETTLRQPDKEAE
jgi:hypothetical protein